jgi:hypothetical protein
MPVLLSISSMSTLAAEKVHRGRSYWFGGGRGQRVIW